MAVFNKTMPHLDTSNVQESLRVIENYIFSMTESIEFFAKNTFRTTEGGNIPAADLGNAVSRLQSSMTLIAGQLVAINTDLKEISETIETINESISSLDERVTALEQK